jgi:spermidine synthase
LPALAATRCARLLTLVPDSTPAPRSPAWLLPLIAVLFFFSGACALVYQVMWLRLLALVFGVTVYAASTVLAGFMAGLAAGSFAAGRLARRFSRPLAAFGAAEILVGLTALGSPVVLESIALVWVTVHSSLPDSVLIVTLIRFLCAFLVLVVPTSLMGATLPLIVKSAVALEPRVGARIGLLYAVNTAGAIAGALVAGFYFISDVGVHVSFLLAAGTNTAIGAVALASAFVLPRVSAPAAEASSPRAAATPAVGNPGQGQQRAVLWTFFLSGLMSLALEIVWFRMLVVYLRPTAYAFTIMLAMVLAGIALGSAVASPLLRRRREWLPALTVIQLAIGIAAVLSFNMLARSQALLDRGAEEGGWLAAIGLDAYLAPIVVSSAAAMLPTTVLLGLAFPIGLALWAGDDANPETSRRVGAFYSLNVVGAIAGSVVAGFVWLPALGSRTSLLVASALAVVSSVMLAAVQWRARPNFAGFVMLVGPVAFAMAGLNTVDPFDVAFERFHRGERLLWRKEGVQTTVAIHERAGGRRPMRVMYLDGMHQANDSDATAFVHHRIGALPVMLHQRPTTALVVGLGGGATPGAVARYDVDVDVVELSAAVVEGSAFFTHINFDLLRRSNVHLRVDDGRNFLMMTRKKYDVITADIILPRHAGAGALYSREYYELVRNVLADGGVALQWNGGETETEYKLLMRTFLSVFPHTTLWGDGSLMLGSLRPFELSRSAFEARRRQPGFTDLFDWDLDTMRRLYVAGPDALRAYVGEGPLLTDDKPVIEYFLSLPENDRPPDLTALTGSLDEVLTP